jgi:hypothetical protein
LSHEDEMFQFSFETFKIKIISLSQSKLTVIKRIFFLSFIVVRSEIKEIRFHMLIITIITSFVLLIASFCGNFSEQERMKILLRKSLMERGTYTLFVIKVR